MANKKPEVDNLIRALMLNFPDKIESRDQALSYLFIEQRSGAYWTEDGRVEAPGLDMNKTLDQVKQQLAAEIAIAQVDMKRAEHSPAQYNQAYELYRQKLLANERISNMLAAIIRRNTFGTPAQWPHITNHSPLANHPDDMHDAYRLALVELAIKIYATQLPGHLSSLHQRVWLHNRHHAYYILHDYVETTEELYRSLPRIHLRDVQTLLIRANESEQQFHDTLREPRF